MLKCGVHKCISSCHQLSDHSKVLCQAPLSKNCVNGHKQSWKCYSGPPAACSRCEQDKKAAAKKAQKILEQNLKRDEETRRHLAEVRRLDDELEQTTQKMKDARQNAEQKAIIEQKGLDIEAAKERLNSVHISRQEDQSRNPENEKMPLFPHSL